LRTEQTFGHAEFEKRPCLRREQGVDAAFSSELGAPARRPRRPIGTAKALGHEDHERLRTSRVEVEDGATGET
jgi:hypothetical protein